MALFWWSKNHEFPTEGSITSRMKETRKVWCEEAEWKKRRNKNADNGDRIISKWLKWICSFLIMEMKKFKHHAHAYCILFSQVMRHLFLEQHIFPPPCISAETLGQVLPPPPPTNTVITSPVSPDHSATEGRVVLIPLTDVSKISRQPVGWLYRMDEHITCHGGKIHWLTLQSDNKRKTALAN